MATSHHPILQENHQSRQTQTMNTSSTTRRRSSKNAQKKKKPPQRGMGVEQLERLRVQEQLKNSNIHIDGTHHQYLSSNNFPNFSSSASATVATGGVGVGVDSGIYSNPILNSSPLFQFPKSIVSPSNDFFVQQKVVNTGFIGSSATTVPTGPSIAFGNQSQIDLYRFVNPNSNNGKSKEIPHLFSNNNSCFSDRCSSCNKKKRVINGDEMNISMENMIREKEVSGTKSFFQNPYSLPSSRLEKAVEIVAIHRKGNSSLSSDEGVVMEYDFFSEKNGNTNHTSCLGKTMKMMSANNSPESSSVAAAMGNINGESSSVTTISWATDTPTSSIDLSLKLSF
ncbi:protein SPOROCYTELESS [Capsicum galapagoense]